MKRTAFKPKAGKVWKRLSPISKNPIKRAHRFITREVHEEVEARSGGICEFVWDGMRCKRVATDKHHIVAKSQCGSNEASNLLHGCRICHDWCKSHPLDSIERGFVKPYAAYIQ